MLCRSGDVRGRDGSRPVHGTQERGCGREGRGIAQGGGFRGPWFAYDLPQSRVTCPFFFACEEIRERGAVAYQPAARDAVGSAGGRSLFLALNWNLDGVRKRIKIDCPDPRKVQRESENLYFHTPTWPEGCTNLSPRVLSA
eukprot:6379154-Prymnesium_polylepis.1